MGLREPFEVVWRVANEGALEALPAWTDELYLSRDPVWDATDLSLAARAQSLRLLPGDAYAAQATVTVSGLVPGAYYLVLRVDKEGKVTEHNRANNETAVAIELAAPDLLPVAIESPAAATVGQQVKVSFTITNQGAGFAPASWTDALYLSPDAKLDFTDSRLAVVTRSLPLAAGDAYLWSGYVSVPRIKPGNYHLLVKTDTDDTILEVGETNNLRSAPLQITAPDLAPLTLSAPTNATIKHTIEVAWTVKNLGAGEAAGSWTDALYLSTDATVDATDNLLTTINRYGPLAPDSFYGVTTAANLPAVPVGQYYLILRTDYGSGTADANRANNERVLAIQIRAPDLVPVTLTAPPIASINQPLEVLWSVENQGGGTAQPSWNDALYLSLDNAWDGEDFKLTTTTRSTALAAGEAYWMAWTVTTPLVLPGDYFLIVRTDEGASVIESTKANNDRALAIRIGAPDLVPATLRASLPASSGGPGAPPRLTSIRRHTDGSVELSWTGADSSVQIEFTPVLSPSNWQPVGVPVNGTNVTLAAAGQGPSGFYRLRAQGGSIPAGPAAVLAEQRLDVHWTIRNADTGTAPPSWTDRLYFSTDNRWDATDTLLESVGHSTLLPVADSYLAAVNVKVPVVAPGTYYLLVRADNDGNLFETDEANNERFLELTVGAPDLTPTNFSVLSVREGGGSALRFDGVDDFVEVPDDPDLHSNRGLTVSGWFRVDGFPRTWQSIVWKGNLPDCGGIRCDNREFIVWIHSSGHLHLASTPESRVGSGQLYVNTAPLIIPGAWNHFAAVIDCDQHSMKVFVNGELRAEGDYDSSNIRDTSGPLRLGGGPNPDDKFLGQLDEVRIWKVPLSTTEIRAEMRNSPTGRESDLMAYWNFDEGIGFTAKDLSGNRHDGSLGGGNAAMAPKWDIASAPVIEPGTSEVKALAANAGELWLSWTIANQGSGLARPNWTDSLYLSTDTIWDFEDTLLGQFTWERRLPAGSSYDRFTAVRLPNVPLGDYHVILRSDSASTLYESTENNNARALPLTITAPDLMPTAINAAKWKPSGAALSFDGVDDSVLLGSQASLNVGIADGLTIEAWILPKGPTAAPGSVSGSGPILEWENGVHFWQWWSPPGPAAPLTGLYVNLVDTSGNSHLLQVPAGIAPNLWYHVAVTYSKSNGIAALYVNADQVASQNLGVFTPKTWTSLNIGRRTVAGNGNIPPGYSFNGLLDEVALYNRALSASEIRANRNRRLTGTESGLVGYWSFDEETGSVALDQAANGNHGSVGGGTVESQPSWVASPVPVFEVEPISNQSPVVAASQSYRLLNWTVTNRGGWPAQGQWVDRVYLSADQWLSLNDVFLGESTWSKALPVAAAYTNSLGVVLPGLPAGTYYLIVQTDAAENVVEASEVNNTGNLDAAVGPTNCLTTNLSPIAWWPGDGSGRDAVGTNHATLRGNATFGMGKIGEAFAQLNGRDAYVRIESGAGLDLLDRPHTLENWINVAAFNSEWAPVTAIRSANFEGLWYNASGRYLRAHVAGSKGRFLDASFSFPLGRWVHVAQVFDFDAARLSIYVDGVLIGSGTSRTSINGRSGNNPVLIGKGWTDEDTFPPYAASFDEVAIHDRALSSVEIQTIYAAGSLGRKCWPSLAIPVTITDPDLVPATLLAPAAAPPSGKIEVSWTVTNQGAGEANPAWLDRLYISSDETWDAQDQLLTEAARNEALPAAGSYTQTRSFTLPTLAEGTYYLMLRADAANALFESNETNNVLAKLLEVRAPETVQTVLRSLNAAEAGFGNLGSLDFSPDGVRLAVAAGNAALIWDLQTGELRRRYYDHNGAIDTVDFSPAGDQVLSGARDGTARIWDADTRKQFRSFPAFPGEADPAVFSGDAARVLAGSGLKLPRLWDMLSGAELTNFLGHANSVTTVALSPDGATALTGSADKTAILWDTATGARLQTFTRHTDAVNAVAFSRDGARVLTASSDGSIILWNVASGAPEVALYQGNAVWGAAFSADGRYVASYNGSSGVAYLWEIASRSLLRTFTPPPEERYPMRGVAVSPDRTVLATTHTDGRIRLWLTGLDAISLHRVSALAVHSDAPVALRSHSVQYFEIAAQPGRNLVIKVEPATNQMTRQAMLAPQSSILNPQSAIDASSDSTVRWQRVGALSEDVQFANLSAPLDTALARQSATGASGFPALPSAIPAVRVVVARGQLPSAYQSELFAQAPLSTLRTEIPVANTTADKYYVLVFSPFLAKGAVNIRVRAEYVDFYLSSVSPNHAGNAGSITVQAHGTGLTPDTTARLIGTNGASIVGQPVFFLDPTRSHLTFDLRGAAPGSYTVQLEKPGAAPAVWSEVFEVGPGTGPRLEAKLNAPSAVRPQRDYTLTLEYANVGDADMAAPLFVVSASQRQPWLYDFVPYVKTLTLAPVNLSSMKKVGEIQLLGINTEGPPGVLPPGARRQIPLYFQAVGNQTEMSFNLEVLRADNTAIDWNVIEAEVRPADLPPDLWTAVWSNFKALAGNTWAEYLHMLDRQANLLAQGGTPTYDLRDLFGAALSQASAGGLRQTLAASVDASASAPGLPLAFSRFALSSLEQRFTIGPLGRGWSHNFEYSLAKADDQTVVVRAPGGGGRRFMLGADAAWKASAGDYGMLLAQAGGAFTLAEKDGLLLSFDANGRLQSVAEPNGNQLALTYTGDQLTGIRHSSGLDLALEYDARGRLSRLTDHAGQVTSYEYDAAGEHLARVVGPGNVTTAYAYEPAAGGVRDHALTSVTFPDGTHQLFSYDARGRLAEQTRDGGAERLRFSYDDSGYVFVTDAYDKVTVLRFGDRGQLLQAADPLGNQALFNYDTQLNLTRLTGPSGEVTELAYDTRGNATRLINPLRQRVDLRYTSLSRLDTLTDARENMTDFTYDPAGNLTGITYPDRSAESFGYDSTGSVTSVRNRRGQTVQFARDALGQITRKLYPGGRTIDYRYDGRGQLTNVTDSAGGEGAPTFRGGVG